MNLQELSEVHMNCVPMKGLLLIASFKGSDPSYLVKEQHALMQLGVGVIFQPVPLSMC